MSDVKSKEVLGEPDAVFDNSDDDKPPPLEKGDCDIYSSMPPLETPKSATAGIFQIITNDGKSDQMLMLKKNLCMFSSDSNSSNSNPDNNSNSSNSLFTSPPISRQKYYTIIHNYDNEVPEVLRI